MFTSGIISSKIFKKFGLTYEEAVNVVDNVPNATVLENASAEKFYLIRRLLSRWGCDYNASFLPDGIMDTYTLIFDMETPTKSEEKIAAYSLVTNVLYCLTDVCEEKGFIANEATKIIEKPGSAIFEFDSKEDFLAAKYFLKNFGVNVSTIAPEIKKPTQTCDIFLTDIDEEICYKLRLNFGLSKEKVKELNNSYIIEDVPQEAASRIKSLFEYRKIPCEIEKNNFEFWITSIGDNRSDILEMITEKYEITEKELDELLDNLPALVLSNDDIYEMIDFKKAIEEAGGTAEIRNACWVTKEGDEEDRIKAPIAVVKGKNLIIDTDFNIFNANKIFVNGERKKWDSIAFKYYYDSQAKESNARYIISNVQKDYIIKVEPKEVVEFYGLEDYGSEDDVVVTYDGKPHDLTKLMSWSNDSLVFGDDIWGEYEREILLDNGDYDYEYYEYDDPPVNVGGYYFYGGMNDYDNYLGDFEGYLTIEKKDLVVKPKDVTVKVGQNFDFETEYDGLVEGDEIFPNEDFEYVIYAEDDAFSRAPTPIPKEDAIKTPGTYIISYVNSRDDLFDEQENYNLIIENGTLTVKEKTSSGGSTMYVITVIENPNATVTPDGKVKVRRLDNQIFEIEANEGYEISDVLVDGESVGAVTQYYFSKVKDKHTLEVIVKEKTTYHNEENFYDDVKKNDWFYEAVKDVTDKDLMNGTGDNKFSPYLGTTRGMIVTILYRLEGKPKMEEETTFEDVAEGQWYTDAIAWGEQHDIILGYGDGTFGPNDTITREQLSAIMYRYTKHKGYDITTSENFTFEYEDEENISGYAVEPMKWACEKELIKGMDNNMLNPRQHATRAQIATVLTRFYEKYIK